MLHRIFRCFGDYTKSCSHHSHIYSWYLWLLKSARYLCVQCSLSVKSLLFSLTKITPKLNITCNVNAHVIVMNNRTSKYTAQQESFETKNTCRNFKWNLNFVIFCKNTIQLDWEFYYFTVIHRNEFGYCVCIRIHQLWWSLCLLNWFDLYY